MKVLLTGFEPFGGESINPAFEILQDLPDAIEGHEIVKREIPTSYKASIRAIEALLEAETPDVVISLGQAGGNMGLHIEKVGLNLRDAGVADNDGHLAEDEVIFPDGDTAYYATVPVRAMVERVRAENIPAAISYSAGAYVCNNVLYALLYLAKTRYIGMRCGFIHVPYFPEQVMGKGRVFYMTKEEMARGLMAAIGAVAAN